MDQRVYITQSPRAVANSASETLLRLSKQAAAEGRPFRVALSGGSTPKLLYRMLASDTAIFRRDIPWGKIDFFFGDERWVPHNDPESNYKLANDELFTPLGIAPDRVYPVPTEGLTPEEAASQYAATLRRVFGTKEGKIPVFDLVFLGMGDDGHTASLFPHTAALDESEKLVTANYVPKLSADRITLSAPVLNAAADTIFMVAGPGKASALKQVLEGEYDPEQYPSQLLRNSLGSVTWLVDEAAAADLDGSYPQV
jgi:6-phosphogluconolactonase